MTNLRYNRKGVGRTVSAVNDPTSYNISTLDASFTGPVFWGGEGICHLTVSVCDLVNMGWRRTMDINVFCEGNFELILLPVLTGTIHVFTCY